MEAMITKTMREMSAEEIHQIAGGVVFLAPVLYSAFVSGAKWGAGVALATYVIQAKFDK